MVYKIWASQTGQREGNKGIRVGKMKIKKNMKERRAQQCIRVR